jgi:hypothetical protein
MTNLITPIRVPRVRDKLVRHWSSDMAATVIAQAPPGFPVNLPGIDCDRPQTFACQGAGPDLAHTRRFCDRAAARIGSDDAGLYWVSKKFGQLAREAAEDLDELEFTADKLPSESGLVVWEKPIADFWHGNEHDARLAPSVDVTAASWFTLQDGIWIILYCNPEQVMPHSPGEILRSHIGELMPVSPGGGALFGIYGRDSMPVAATILARLLATWFLIAQPGVADVSTVRADKQVGKQYTRRGRRHPEVRVVNLRRRPVPEVDESRREDARGDQPYERKWIRGHWKQQAFGPGHALRYPLYVARYLRGPDGAPIVNDAPVATVKTLR